MSNKQFLTNESGVSTVGQLFEKNVNSSPDATAIRWNGTSYSYAELDKRVGQIAQSLMNSGVEAGSAVGVFQPRSFDLIASVLGIMRAGCVMVPLDPAYPAPRTLQIIQQAGLSTVLSQGDVKNTLPESVSVVDVNTIAADAAAFNGAVETDADQVSYMIFTSGSSGVPKGVMLPQRTLVNLMHAQLDQHDSFAQAMTTLQFTSLNFDVSLQEIFSTLSFGGTLVLMNEQQRNNFKDMLALINDENVARVFMPYAVLQGLIDAAEQYGMSLPSLQVVVTAGEQLKITPSIREFFSRHNDVALINHYGPTETHLATSYVLSGDAADWADLPSIGGAITGVKLYVLDETGEPVKAGETGELFIGGAQVGLGYIGNDEQTAAAFVNDPFAGVDQAVMYKSGDLVRVEANGELAFLGRNDDQVKIAGNRVELGEIEIQLMKAEGVQEAAVVALTSESGQRSLAAAVIPTGTANCEPATLKAQLADMLPAHLIPGQWQLVHALPKMPNGKLNRNAIAEEFGAPPVATAAAQNAETTLEKLAAIWCSVLELETVSPEDDFFDIGGHSFSMMKLKVQIDAVFGVDIGEVEFFDNTELGLLAALIDTKL